MDIEYLLFLQNLRELTGNVLTPFMSFITTYGEELYTMMIVAAVYWCADKSQGIFTLMTWGAGRVLNGFLKLTACVYRPWIRDARVQPVPSAFNTATGYSFPSGHSTNAAAVYGSLAMNKKISRLIRVLLIVMIALVLLSRNYLGVHTPQDVLVGCGSTLILVALFHKLMPLIENDEKIDMLVLIIGCAICVLVVFYAMLKPYPHDYDAAGQLIVDPAKMAIDTYKGCGFGLAVLIGSYIERHYVRFSVEGTWQQRVGRYFLGMLGYFVVLYVLLPMLPAGVIGAILDRFIRLIYIVLIVPVFIKLSQKQ
ncbi:MAG: phosphatase PAP2 family protein [Eubacteriales bacterium]|nr:phosphatase PAP2 family protein [Eubacteriales bacterium]